MTTAVGGQNMLMAIELLHTTVQTLLAGCILALPILALKRRIDWAVIVTAIILIECGVLALNPWTISSDGFSGPVHLPASR